MKARWLKQWDLQLMVIPALLFVFLFSYIPMWGIIISFQQYNLFKGVFHSPWVGFDNFEQFFNAPEFWQIMRNTIVISLLKFVTAFPAPIVLALLLNEIRSMPFKRFVQTVTYLPHFMSWVIVATFVTSLLSVDNGSLNLLFQKLHLIGEPVNWLSIPEYFWAIVTSVGVWKEIGFAAIVYLAAIAGVDPCLYESAAMDGASRLRQMFSITIPCISPVIVIFLILAIGNILYAGFEDLLLLGKNPVLSDVANVIDTYVYRMGLKDSQRYSYATAAGLFQAIVNVILLVIANRTARRFGHSLW
ncbi:ABC transporter permease [Cohnella nanjingensis]|uniref:Sugar ABC transporter permease n=1 Tax=Cohnella nanjingensis TaxID=1387779 RepID=A0A7X0RQ37_9BACL|nr:ABC transporter permease subunit [Cohnella nanjingensis]MBB6671637.1 sugar ABC transporter permease [Cohnella nanjingensis]